LISAAVVERLTKEARMALRRRPAHEAKLAGALRVLAPHAVELMRELGDVAETIAHRGSFERPLYGAAVRALGERADARLADVLTRVLPHEHAGGLPSLAAACFMPQS
jgi:hypothetical protein